MYKCLFLIWLFVGFVLVARAQTPDTVAVKNKADSLTLKRDSAKSKKYYPKITQEKAYHPDSLHSPHKAVMRSLMIPGWGQLYNHRWWKVPVIYAGIGLLVDAVIFNQHYYSIFLKEAKLREKGIQAGRNPLYTDVSDPDITSAVNAYVRNRDLCILGTLGAWGIQMIDAYIDAKFIQSYTMDNNLSFKVSPGVISQPYYATNSSISLMPAIKITFTLK
ncbi:MAG TPA: DUF5683 domain-containing protein [Mucilaginibacter sp.]|nr:DUF5683 domain-containing protein [Mucilaginibacter sp.]